LSDLDLIYIIKSQGSDYWQSIAARDTLSDHVIDVLADTKDIGTALVLTQNDRIHLTRHAIDILAVMARENETLAKPLLARPELPGQLVRELYSHVGAELKAYIRTAHGLSDEAGRIVDEVVVEFVEAYGSEFIPTEQMIETARKFGDMGLLN